MSKRMADKQTVDNIAQALTNLLDAHREYDKEYNTFEEATGGYSWNYFGGEYIDNVNKAHESLATALNEYIDNRVAIILLQMQKKENQR